MDNKKVLDFIKNVFKNMPSDWLNLTTHHLDIYDETRAKTQFLEQLENLFNQKISESEALSNLPTAFDYIRLGHPLSCVLEWIVAKLNNTNADRVISFSSRTMPILAILRKNLLDNKNTKVFYTGELPEILNSKILKDIYSYNLELVQIEIALAVPSMNDCSTIFLSEQDNICHFESNPNIDFFINTNASLGSVLFVNGKQNLAYISEIQHVRRRETIAMTPINCHAALKYLVDHSPFITQRNIESNKASVRNSIKEITGTHSKPLVASSGLSIQYAIMMGLIDEALKNHKGKDIKLIVPTNCYGGTNDQARRVAACINKAEVVDLAVDGDSDMVQSIDTALSQIAAQDAVPIIIAEIPTNPRVEVPDLLKLKEVLTEIRKTSNGDTAIDPIFILDQTFCPNIHFLGDGEILSTVRAISYASGSKFPSGGKCTAGYCVANTKAASLMEKIELHLSLCDNEATSLQYELLAQQLPSMIQRIKDAYINTREFVNFIKETLPAAKINFVSEELAKQGFTPSVFSLDLPTKGNTDEERETYKRELNLKLINLMITEIPDESKYCVSYGQLKGCYWTIPATSTQGTTKEGDKDYIARVALSPSLNLDLHKKVFKSFVESV